MRQRLPAEPRAPVTQVGEAPSSVKRTFEEPGTRLPADLQAEAIQRLGFDFSTVRIHADGEAAASAREMSFRAYAARPHVVFAPDMYRPDTPRGRALVMHELGHIKQQESFVPGAPIRVSRSAAHERNADQLWQGATDAAIPMRANVVAGESETSPGPAAFSANDVRARAERDARALGSLAELERTLLFSHWRSATERRLYTQYFLAARYRAASGGEEIDGDRLDEQLVYYENLVAQNETRVQAAQAQARERREREELESELQRLVDEERLQDRVRSIGAFDVRSRPVLALNAAVGAALQQLAPAVEVIVGFIPIVGQVVLGLEAILGRQIFTGQELSTFQRGLGLLLLALPFAGPILRAGRAGAQAIFQIGRQTGRNAFEVLRLIRGMGQLSERAVLAAQQSARAGQLVAEDAAALRQIESALTPVRSPGVLASEQPTLVAPAGYPANIPGLQRSSPAVSVGRPASAARGQPTLPVPGGGAALAQERPTLPRFEPSSGSRGGRVDPLATTGNPSVQQSSSLSNPTVSLNGPDLRPLRGREPVAVTQPQIRRPGLQGPGGAQPVRQPNAIELGRTEIPRQPNAVELASTALPAQPGTAGPASAPVSTAARAAANSADLAAEVQQTFRQLSDDLIASYGRTRSGRYEQLSRLGPQESARLVEDWSAALQRLDELRGLGRPVTPANPVGLLAELGFPVGLREQILRRFSVRIDTAREAARLAQGGSQVIGAFVQRVEALGETLRLDQNLEVLWAGTTQRYPYWYRVEAYFETQSVPDAIRGTVRRFLVRIEGQPLSYPGLSGDLPASTRALIDAMFDTARGGSIPRQVY